MPNTVSNRSEDTILRKVMPELDSVRGVAILMVYFFHAFEDLVPTGAPLPRWEHWFLSVVGMGWTGVNLFFVLSGFLITGILLDSVNKPNYYSKFYYRRALRILPAYYLLLVILLVVGRISFFSRPISWVFAGMSIVYLSNIARLVGVTQTYAALWSLSVEEHFYLLWPTAVKWLTRKKLAILAGCICLCEPVLRACAVYRGGLWWGPYTWLCADGLALGSLLAIFARSAYGARRNVLKVAGLSLSVAVMAILISTVAPVYISISLRATCVTYSMLALLAATLWVGSGTRRGLVNVRLLSFYGFISYGLYLIHPFVLRTYDDISRRWALTSMPMHSFGYCMMRLPIVLLLSTGIAYLSRVTYEQFFLQMKGKKNAVEDSQSSKHPEELLPTR